MVSINDFKKLSFLVYGLGITGQSVVKFFKKNNIKKYYLYDDKFKKNKNLDAILKEVDFIVLSPGISLKTSKNKKKLANYQNKIITDIDLIYLTKKNFRSIVVTGTNGKSTTCKMIYHLLKKNNYKTLLGGNIGTPILSLNIQKNNFIVIEASSFQLAHSKYICPDFAILLNITNDHLDWHGNMKNYIESKFKIFKLQKKNQFSIANKKLKKYFNKRKFLGKQFFPNLNSYVNLKIKIKNLYLKSLINDENMATVFELSKILKINEKTFIKSLNSFKGLPHRYEIFLKKKNCIFINDSKATSFQATNFALQNSKNIFWIVGGLPKENDRIILNKAKRNIIKSYIIGKNIKFFKRQLKNRVNYCISKNLKNSIIQILKDIKLFKKKNNIILLSPAAASYDQYLNFEKRGEEFKRLSKNYARKYI
tara:strand:+ start:140 stop:1408 length:1269 start_codon:yes stop_codon:yes gene_type:complete